MYKWNFKPTLLGWLGAVKLRMKKIFSRETNLFSLFHFMLKHCTEYRRPSCSLTQIHKSCR